jgi:hypothetical protein
MRIEQDNSKPTGLDFQCSASKSACGKQKSALGNSWLADSRLGLRGSLLVITGYAAELSYSQMRFFCELGSDSTIANWNHHFRTICAEETLCSGFWQIGGPGMTVEIDETFLFRQKYNVGRTLFNERESIWILGGVCRENKEAFAVHVLDRRAETLE